MLGTADVAGGASGVVAVFADGGESDTSLTCMPRKYGFELPLDVVAEVDEAAVEPDGVVFAGGVVVLIS